jgi:hypothetical protein
MQNPRVALATISLFAQLPLDIFFLWSEYICFFSRKYGIFSIMICFVKKDGKAADRQSPYFES